MIASGWVWSTCAEAMNACSSVSMDGRGCALDSQHLPVGDVGGSARQHAGVELVFDGGVGEGGHYFLSFLDLGGCA